MKKLIGSCLVALAGVANAAGVYDGIYQNVNSPNVYASIHTNGSQVIMTSYSGISATNITLTSILGTVGVSAIPIWELYSGPINGSFASVLGQGIYNACNISLNINFTSASFTAYVTDRKSVV